MTYKISRRVSRRTYKVVTPALSGLPKSYPTKEFISEYKEHPGYTVAQMRAMSKDYFFSPSTMKFFGKQKFSSYHSKKTGKDYLIVTFKDRPGHYARYEFNPKEGSFNSVEAIE